MTQDCYRGISGQKEGRTLVLRLSRYTRRPAPANTHSTQRALNSVVGWGVEGKGYSVIKRIGVLIVVALVAVMMLAATAMPSLAAPITCPGSQDAEKVGGEWRCVNPADNPTGADKPKNPNR
jgi:hypothetical protein